jgi:hypothetical protein
MLLRKNWNRKVKCGSLSERRVDADLSAMHLNDVLCDCETQTCPALFFRRGAIRLLEFLKYYI